MRLCTEGGAGRHRILDTLPKAGPHVGSPFLNFQAIVRLPWVCPSFLIPLNLS